MAQPAYSNDGFFDPWATWRHQVVVVIRAEFPEILQDVGHDDIDWDAWRPLFDQGLSPTQAVDDAFVRVTED
ncbi:MAG: hypothetical protein ACJ8MR_07335 [Povalibacter sp.]|jgi:hypothetical protein